MNSTSTEQLTTNAEMSPGSTAAVAGNDNQTVHAIENDSHGAGPTHSANSTLPRNGGLTLPMPKNDSFSGDVHYRKHRPHSGLDAKASPGIIIPKPYLRATSYQPSISGMSNASHSEHDHNIPPPSTDKERSKHGRRYFATVFSIMYAIFLVMFALIAFIGDAVKSQYPVGEVFGIIILVIGFVYFIALYTDIRLHIKEAKQAWKERVKRMELFEERLAEMQNNMQSSGGPLELANGTAHLGEWDVEPVKPVSHRYCFQTGRHGELFYLKLGAAWFCFGLLIHSVLTISYQVIFLTDEKIRFTECASVLTLIMEILFPLYSIFVLFFIFKYANVIINKARGAARFFLMHAIGTSLAFWVYTIVRETVDAIRLKDQDDYSSAKLAINSTDIEFMSRISMMTGEEGEEVMCPAPDVLNSIYRNFSPYLYPFVIEFCILVVGIYYMIWASISRCPKKTSAKGHDHHPDDHGMLTHSNVENGTNNHHNNNEDGKSVSSDHCSIHHSDHDANYKSNLVLYADCHASSRGLFAGLSLIVLTIVVIILFFVAVNEPAYIDTGIIMNSSFEFAVLVVLILAVIAAYLQVSKLDINSHSMSMLDDVLLFIAIPAFFMDTIFSFVPAVVNGSWLNMLIKGAQLIQVLIQTPFIIDGMRRCANAPALRRKKPGRELITFLTIANVSLWLYYTFSVKTADTRDERYPFYGYLVWNILNHLSLPLIMFYRFHASVCLVDIWKHAYEPGGGH